MALSPQDNLIPKSKNLGKRTRKLTIFSKFKPRCKMHRGFFMPVSGRMRLGRAFFIAKIARHGVKLHSQGGCDPRKQSAGGKDTPMKREEVKNKIPGITDDQLDWLMGENGRDVTAEKTKAAGLQGQVDDLTKQLTTAKDGLKAFEGVDVAELKGQITKLQDQLTEQADSFAFDAALDGAIRDAHGRDVKAIRGMLDVDTLKASKDRTSDIKAAIEALVKDKAWAFGGESTGMTMSTGTEHGEGGNAGEADGVVATFAAMNPNLKI